MFIFASHVSFIKWNARSVVFCFVHFFFLFFFSSFIIWSGSSEPHGQRRAHNLCCINKWTMSNWVNLFVGRIVRVEWWICEWVPNSIARFVTTPITADHSGEIGAHLRSIYPAIEYEWQLAGVSAVSNCAEIFTLGWYHDTTWMRKSTAHWSGGEVLGKKKRKRGSVSHTCWCQNELVLD